MLRLIQSFLFTFFVLLVFNCNKPTGPVIPDVTTTEAELANFQVIIADYDNVVFKNNDDLLIKNKDVYGILLGSLVNGVFESEQAIAPVFFNAGDKYKLGFEIPTKVDKEIYQKIYVLRFKMTDDSYIDINAPVDFYKYPYENAQIFLHSKEVESFAGKVQDISIKQTVLYFFPGGGGDPGEYNLLSKDVKKFPPTSGGDFITADDSFAYYNNGPSGIHRYNFEPDSVDIKIFISPGFPGLDKWYSVYGLATYQENLYAIIHEANSEEDYFLAKFDKNLNFIDFIPMSSTFSIFLAINSGIAYSYNYSDNGLALQRFDISSKTLLSSLPVPTLDPTGMDVYNGRFYYSDWSRLAIFSIPLSDIE